ncbi:hypothetical protein GCM10023346_34570 [Arthrobacter gyeryongensis]|uniref:Uncharacterized protein n=1 Tax=Arthrobacter gyeryongensis TaxID=1650592 RepID=A0ABP9SMI9_9MICC
MPATSEMDPGKLPMSRGMPIATAKFTAVMGRNPRAGLQGVESEHFLQELRGEEKEPDHCAQVQKAGDIGAGSAAAREQPQRHDRLGRRALDQHEYDQEDDAGTDGRDRDRRVPAGVDGVDDAEHESADTQGGTERAEAVEAATSPA